MQVEPGKCKVLNSWTKDNNIKAALFELKR